MAAASSRTFRVFVSSTFEDFKKERNALQTYVFPRLQELCAQYQKRFQAIDLRWGVSEEAGLDQRAVAICLDEIARCQRLTPRPNFILLLGDRYGWRPLPSRIEKAEFESILARVPEAGGGSSDRALLLWTDEQPKDRKGWYRLDENADPGEYVLLARVVEVPEGATTDARKAAQTAEYEAWRDRIEPRLRAILLAAIDGLGWAEDDPRRAKYVASATEQEIVRGVLEPKDAAEHVFGFYRTILARDGKPLAEADGVPPDGSARGFLDEIEVKVEVEGRITHEWVWDKAAHDRLVALKEKLPLREANVSDYSATWIGPAKLEPSVPPDPDFSPITVDHIGALPHPHDPNGPDDPLDTADPLADCLKLLSETELPHTLCNDVWRNLAGMILTQVKEQKPEEAVEAEVKAHGLFGAERCSDFVGRAEPLAAIAKYLNADEHQPLAVIGEPGSGKSALMAKAFEEAEADHSKAVTVVRFIGATPGSLDGRTLLGNLCRQITSKYSGDEPYVPTEYSDLAVEFAKRLELATAERPLIVFLDALDQLGASDPARALSWLPAILPDHVRLVVSTLPGDCERALRAKRPRPEFLPLDRMTQEEGETALGQWLKKAERTLRAQQRKEILDRFEPEGRPLYLKLAFEEARLWPSYDEPGRRALREGIPALISENLFYRLAKPASHGRVLVSHALGYLAASRYGLSEDELLDVLSADLAVMGDFHDRSPRSPKVAQLPVVVWSRLYFDLEPYLSEHAGEGATLLAFFHRQLGEAATREFLDGDEGPARHTALARYFRAKADPAAKRTWSGGSVRGLGELPYHLAGAGDLHELYATLTDFRFLEHKAADVGFTEQTIGGTVPRGRRRYAGPLLLRDDFALALLLFGAGSSAGGKAPLIVTGVTFGGGTVIRCPWCHEWSPFDEEWRGTEIACPHCQGPLRVNAFLVGESILEAVHGGAEAGREAVSDGRGAVLAAFRKALGRETHVVTEHVETLWQQLYNRLQWEGEAVTGALALPLAERTGGGPDVVPWLRTLTPFGESPALLATLVSRWSVDVCSCAFSPDGQLIVAGRGMSSQSNRLEVWDAESGQELRSVSPHHESVTGCAFSPDGRYIASAGSGSGDTLILWDRDRLTQVRALEATRISWCAFTPDGRSLVSTGGLPGMRRWNLETESLEPAVVADDRTLSACAVSPDGSFIVAFEPSGWGSALVLLDVATGGELRSLQWGSSCVAITPDSRFVVSGHGDGTLKLWDAQTGENQMILTGHKDTVLACAVSPDGRFIVSGSADRTLRLWDLVTGTSLGVLSGHTDRVLSCAVSPDGRFIVSGSNDNTLKLWDAQNAEEPQVTPRHTGRVNTCAFSPDGRFIVSGASDGTLKLWDAGSGKELVALQDRSSSVSTCAFSPDGRLIVSGGADSSLRLWDAGSGSEVWALAGQHNGVDFCTFSPDGRDILSVGGMPGSGAKSIKVCDTASGQMVATLMPEGEHITACALSPDGREVVVGIAAKNGLRFLDIETGNEVRTLNGDSVYAFAFSPDGRFVIASGVTNYMTPPMLWLWDMQTGGEVWTAHNTPHIAGFAFTPDGRHVLSACSDGTVRLFDAGSGKELSTLALLGEVGAIATHPGLRRAVCGDRSGSVYQIELVGIEYGPIIVTAREQGGKLNVFGGKLSVRCPTCREELPLKRAQLGQELACPRNGCETRLRLNQFTLHSVSH